MFSRITFHYISHVAVVLGLEEITHSPVMFRLSQSNRLHLYAQKRKYKRIRFSQKEISSNVKVLKIFCALENATIYSYGW